MKQPMKPLFKAIVLGICLVLLGYQLAYESKSFPNIHTTLKKFLVLFVDENNNKVLDTGEPLVVMAADDYRELFQRDAPLERMLRSQIKGTEFIVLTQEDFDTLDTNRDRILTAADTSPYYAYDLYMAKNAPQNKQLSNITHPSIFIYKASAPNDVWNYIIISKHRPFSAVQRDKIAGKAILQALHIKTFSSLPQTNTAYTLNNLQKKIIIQTILSLPDNLSLYKIYFARVNGTIEHDFITTEAKMMHFGELKGIVLSRAKTPMQESDGDAAYFDNGIMMKIRTSPHHINWMGL